MKQSQFKWIMTCMGLSGLLMVTQPTFAALGGNIELNNNYFGHLDDYQKSLLSNNEEHHLKVAITKLSSGKPWQIQYVKQQMTYFLPRWPNHPKALQIVSEVALRTHDPAYALRWFTKGIDAFPRVYQTYVLYGIYLYRSEQYSKAEKEFRTAVTLAPDSSETNYNLGLALFHEHHYGEANKYAQRAYQLGYPLDGLRRLLKKAGSWSPRPGASEQASSDAGPGVSASAK